MSRKTKPKPKFNPGDWLQSWNSGERFLVMLDLRDDYFMVCDESGAVNSWPTEADFLKEYPDVVAGPKRGEWKVVSK